METVVAGILGCHSLFGGVWVLECNVRSVHASVSLGNKTAFNS